MLRVWFIFIPFLLIACSKDKPAPVAPAGKAQAVLEAPAAPTNLRFDAVTDSSARVAWDAVEGATDYDVNYKEAVGGRWTNEPHKGTRLYNTIYDLKPNTEYRWAVRAENRDGPSDWVFGERFTTKALYIRPIIESSLTVREEEIFLQALADWENIIISGHPDGLEVYALATTWGNYATITEFDSYNGYAFPTHCQIHLLSASRYNYDGEDNFRWSVLHELGHCLGIGTSDEWTSRIETRWGWWEGDDYEVVTLEDGQQGRLYERLEGPIQPHFIGDNARETFMRLSENQWGDHPYVPLNWDRWNGSDSSHVDDPILSRSIMTAWPADYGNQPFQKVSSIEAAFLKDMGYEVVEDVEDILLIGGFEGIESPEWGGDGLALKLFSFRRPPSTSDF